MNKNIGLFAILFISLTSTVFGDFKKNTQLVEDLKESNVRLVVLCNFQGTNNVLDIVTSSRSPGYELTNSGLAKLADVSSLLQPLNITHIYTAPAFRAQQSTNLLGKAFRLSTTQLTVDARLGMQNFGMAEGEDYDVYKQRFTSRENMLQDTPDNGESGQLLFNRTENFLMSLEKNSSNQTILVITHAFNFCHISKCLTGKFGSIPAPGDFTVYNFSNGSL